MSRTTIAHLFHSLDGVVGDPHLWQFDSFGDEDGAAMDAHLAPVTDAVIGRTLWKEWLDYWPNAEHAGEPDDFVGWINPVRKHVVSSTLAAEYPDGLPWNSTLATGDPVAFMRRLKASGSGDIAVLGGIRTVRSLFLAGMIDQLTLTTHPVVAGSGRRLFDGTVPTTRLRLLNSSRTSSGNAVLTYGLRD
ncbi:dihydrofolate reductase family protein [Corynebacterium kalidii]|uniref:Dihydrofolate reductase family protein n=1 Tax=Corynebacterium kalidii TaxID=2931982 RepID=A0A9X1WI75_9CORY|nr:dihydrofolate reductase family protein [Corynebacterium kalidii]MCJ7858067.1 dihydrofolate reductase family protein [Corynebacterium kalidii]